MIVDILRYQLLNLMTLGFTHEIWGHFEFGKLERKGGIKRQ